MDKIFKDADSALFDVSDGATIMSGGFGLCGNPENLIEALLRRATRELTLISNNCGTDGKGLGNAKANKTLSSNRAKSVMNWLVKNGVSKDRLSFEGFGQEKPIDSNNTDEGRKNNRRVEFHIESDAK